ncbi:MAG: PKD domain-containing protein [Ferruginibacter sp.]
MRIFILPLLLIPFFAKSQSCSSIPGMTPSTAIPVCGTSSFFQNNVSSCNGPSIPNAGVCADVVTSNNSFWYKFHCFQSGTLGFLITPLGANDDYDWEVFNLTGHTANDVYSFESMRLSLNISGITGTTGCTSAGTGSSHCSGGASGTQYNAMPSLIAGSDYLIMVTNWSNSGLGYRLNFSGGTAIITDPTPPTFNNVITSCNSRKIKLQFSTDIRCTSVTATGSEFVIMPNNIPAASIVSNCAAGYNSISELTVNIPPLGVGNYSLVVQPGTDGNTFKDACDNEMVPGTSILFTILPQTFGTIDRVTSTGCAPTMLEVWLTEPILCNSFTTTGSEFSITPGNPSIASVQSVDCSNGLGFTKKLQIFLNNPLPFGNYQLTLNNGSDGNTLIDTCNAPMPVNTVSNFNIAQVAPPVVQSIDFSECRPDQVVLNFDKAINCNSLSANGSEFTINPGNLPVSAVFSSCSTGSYTPQIILYLQNQLPAGNFSVTINNGSDGNTISDTCFSFISAGYNKSFVTTQAPLPVFDSVVFNKCNPTSLRAYYSKPILCSSVSADGSDFLITGPSGVTINSASTDPATCSQGYTGWIDLLFAVPINLTGTYILHNKVGTDANGIVDTCLAAQSTAETISFNAFAKLSAVFSNQIKLGCVNDTINLSHPGGNGINSWAWNFSDNTSASGQNVTHLFPVSTPTATIQLIVSNGQCPDTSTVTVTLGNAYQAAFIPAADTVCIGSAVSFSNTSTGNNLSYAWDFGDNTSFIGQTPAPHNYASSNSYSVDLIVSTNTGCKDTANKIVVISALPVFDFGVLKPKYCSGDNVQLSANLQGNISSYAWDNGDGKTFSNVSQINFRYNSENTFTVALAVTDKYCGQLQKTKTTQVYSIPVVALGNDTTFCPGMSTILGEANNSAYTYLWSTGAITSQVTTDQLTKTYRLTASNNGCVASDDIFVKVLLTCLIKVPNAFTPNSDGLNDQLKAVNADLAKNFSFSVYNRFGQRMFFTRNPLKGWDGYYRGQPAETGAYIWQVSYIDPTSQHAVYEKGSSLLIR